MTYISADPFAQYQQDQNYGNQPSLADLLKQIQSGSSFYNTGSSLFGYPSTGSLIGGGSTAAPVSSVPGGAATGFGAGFPGWMGGSGAGGGGGMAGAAGPAALFAALIAAGKMTEYKNPDTPMSKASLGLLGPSINQAMADPKGIALPTALGLPFLAPFTGKKDAQAAKPEWAGAMGK